VSENVIVTQGTRGGRRQVVHTDPECPALGNSGSVREVARSKYPNRSECQWCSGSATPRGENTGPDIHENWQALAEASPEDLGLPKAGDRS